MKYRMVCDTNILISALLFPNSNPDEIVKLARIGEIELYISPFILNEFERVLREKFDYDSNEIKKRSDRIKNISKLIAPPETISAIDADKSDNRILECALEAKAHFLVSGDKHLLALKEYGSTKIVSASLFLQLRYK